MANEQNLRPGEYKFTQEDAKKGQIASAKKRAERKTLREELLLLLAKGDTQERLSLSIIQKALTGDTKAYEVIRDTIGEKPKDVIDANVNTDIKVTLTDD